VATAIATFVLLALVMAAMAVGVMFRRQPLKGSCGGLNNAMGSNESCSFCGGNPDKCEEQSNVEQTKFEQAKFEQAK